MGVILCRYDRSRGDLFVRSCESVLRVRWSRVCSCEFMSGVMLFMTLLGSRLVV